MSEFKKVVVVTDEDTGEEALFVDGVLKLEENTVYACDISEYTGDGPVIFKHVLCDFRETDWKWPEKFEDVPVVVFD